MIKWLVFLCAYLTDLGVNHREKIEIVKSSKGLNPTIDKVYVIRIKDEKQNFIKNANTAE